MHNQYLRQNRVSNSGTLMYWLSIIIIISCVSSCDKRVCDPQGKYLVVTTLSGTSNRLRVIASSQIMATLTGRKLLLDWPIVSGEMPSKWTDLFSNKLDWFDKSVLPEQGCSLKRIKKASEDSKVIKNLGYIGKQKDINSVRAIPELNEPIVYYSTAWELMPDDKYLSTTKYREQYRSIYQTFQPVSDVRKAVDKFQLEHNFKDYYMVGVHYRSWNAGRADNYVTKDLNFKYVDDAMIEMINAINLPSAERMNKETAFFLSSDNPEVKKRFFSKPELQGRIFTREDTIERNTIEGQKSALVDWYLLAETNYIIGTLHSSFSDEAAHLTTQDRKIDYGESAFRNVP